MMLKEKRSQSQSDKVPKGQMEKLLLFNKLLYNEIPQARKIIWKTKNGPR